MKSRIISGLIALAMVFSLISSVLAANETQLFQNWSEAAYTAELGTDYDINNSEYIVKTAKGLAWIAKNVNDGNGSIKVKLANDIDLSGVVDDSQPDDENSWIPIGGVGCMFSGTFDGQGHSISGMNIKSEQKLLYKGLFGVIGASGVVENVKIINSKIDLIGTEYNDEKSSPISHSDGGGIAGENRGTIRNCENEADINGTETGGIAGVNRGTIEKCRNGGNILGYEEVGGIAGLIVGNSSTKLHAHIIDCVNTGNVSGGYNIGGIAGRAAVAEITGSINSGNVSGGFNIGGILGGLEGGVAENCENTGIITGTHVKSRISSIQNIGGIAGHLWKGYADSWRVQSCSNKGAVLCTSSEGKTTDGWSIGGIAGIASTPGYIIDCVNDGDIGTTGSSLGGIIGRLCGGSKDAEPIIPLINCVNNGNVTGHRECGGIAGQITTTIANSYNTGTITAKTEAAGGIVGDTDNYSSTLTSGEVLNCYNIGTVTSDKNAGAIAGTITYGNVQYCYYPQGEKISGTASKAVFCEAFDVNGIFEDGTHLISKLNANIKKLSPGSWYSWLKANRLPAVFDKDNINPDVLLTWAQAGNAAHRGIDYTIDGDTYTIFTPLGLAFIANTVNRGTGAGMTNKTVLLNNDIDLSGVIDDSELNDETSWNPIGVGLYGDNIICFNGTFDGQNHTISGMKISREDYDQGLFGTVWLSATIKNLNVTNSSVTTTDPYKTSYSVKASAIIAANNFGNIINCTTDENSKITTNQYGAGGIVGSNHGTIDDCHNMAEVTSNYGNVGGICSSNNRVIKNCSNRGTITANIQFYAGGIVAENDSHAKGTLIMNCCNYGDIVSNLLAGGICADSASDYDNSLNRIINSYNVGSVYSKNSYAGGIIGCVRKSEIHNCYNSGVISSTKGEGGIAGRIEKDAPVISNCGYLYSSATAAISNNQVSYEPVNCYVFDDDGIIADTETVLYNELNNNVLLLNEPKAFTWIEGTKPEFAKFSGSYQDSLEISEIKVEKQPVSTYIEGQTFNPQGIEIELLYENGSKSTVKYDDTTKADFTFMPSLETPLELSDTEVVFEYKGHTASIAIKVEKKSVIGEDTPSINASLDLNEDSSIARITAAPKHCGKGLLIVALYKDEKLVGVKIAEYNGTDSIDIIEIPYTVKPNSAKIMMWDSLNNMKPLCNFESLM